jgi:hypothetical protein
MSLSRTQIKSSFRAASTTTENNYLTNIISRINLHEGLAELENQ